MRGKEPLTRQQVIDAIERQGGSEIPLVFHKWWGEGLQERCGKQLDEMASKYPDDIFVAWYTAPGGTKSTTSNPGYRWGYKKTTAVQPATASAKQWCFCLIGMSWISS